MLHKPVGCSLSSLSDVRCNEIVRADWDSTGWWKVSKSDIFVIAETNCRAGRYKLAGSPKGWRMAISFVTIEPPQPQDQDIRQQLGAGRYHEAFEQLLERKKEKVFRLCFSMVRNETQAED